MSSSCYQTQKISQHPSIPWHCSQVTAKITPKVWDGRGSDPVSSAGIMLDRGREDAGGAVRPLRQVCRDLPGRNYTGSPNTGIYQPTNVLKRSGISSGVALTTDAKEKRHRHRIVRVDQNGRYGADEHCHLCGVVCFMRLAGSAPEEGMQSELPRVHDLHIHTKRGLAERGEIPRK